MMPVAVKSESPGQKILALIQSRYPTYHPLMAIADLAHEDEMDARIRLDCHKTIARYTVPELKSIEIKSEHQETKRVIVSLFTDAEAQASEDDALEGEVIKDALADLSDDELGIQTLQIPAESSPV